MLRILLVTKNEVDNYFTDNFKSVQTIIKKYGNACVTSNITDITTDVYLICARNCHKIQADKIREYIISIVYKTYAFTNSEFNRENKSISNTLDLSDIITEESETNDELFQGLDYALAKYKQNAEPHELRMFDVFVNKGIRTVRKLSKHLGTSHYGAHILLTEFKQKIKQYERERQIEESSPTSGGGEAS